ncbi:MAG TPA: response regulator [Acidimicrobiales bacterium]|nr:response regulator [Acidimicrobiales bacterium]
MAVQVAGSALSASLGLRVALVDNRLERRQLMRHVVEAGRAGAVVVGEADCGTDAIGVVAEEQANIAVVEIQLPIDEGLKVIRELRERFSDLGIVVCSFHIDRETQERARACGADVYLAKPIRPRELSEAISALTVGLPSRDPE